MIGLGSQTNQLSQGMLGFKSLQLWKQQRQRRRSLYGVTRQSRWNSISTKFILTHQASLLCSTSSSMRKCGQNTLNIKTPTCFVATAEHCGQHWWLVTCKAASCSRMVLPKQPQHTRWFSLARSVPAIVKWSACSNGLMDSTEAYMKLMTGL